MPFTLTMPKLSPTMEEGTVAKWHKKEGEAVQPGDVVMEVTTDKATVEYQAVDEGYLRRILVEEGATVRINEAIAVLTADAKESIEGYVPEGLKLAKPAIAEETAPRPVEAEAKKARPEGGAVAQPAFEPVPPLTSYQFPSPAVPATRVVASPLAKKLAQLQHLDLSTVAGSGPGGRIVKRDLAKAQPAATVTFGSHSLPTLLPGTYEEETPTPMRRTIGRRLQQSKTFVPHFYVTQEVDASPLTEARRQLQEYGIKLSYNDLILRAVALALREKPALNSGYNTITDKIIRFKTIDIAVAVSIEGGLVTPIVRHADYKNVGQIGIEVKALAKKAREGKLQPEEYLGGSFTLSNLGMYGITEFLAIINPPQAAILAVGGVRDCPVVRSGAIVPGQLMNLSLACDHRVVDGAEAADYLGVLKRFLENPAGLLV
jgi:pyruvate dehydrogenase E2 component (dihydrolipoamide acetyltransferase)